MPVKVRCQGCQTVLNAPDAARGKALKCPKCEARVRVPAAGKARKSAGGPRKARRPGRTKSGPGALTDLDLRHAEDRHARICPKCATNVSEEDIECPNCGVNIETGVLSAEQRIAHSRKGPDPALYYNAAWADSWQFLKKNVRLAVRTAVVWMVAATVSALSAYALDWSVKTHIKLIEDEVADEPGIEITRSGIEIHADEKRGLKFLEKMYYGEVILRAPRQLAFTRPPAVFWMFMITVFALAIPGWYWLMGIQVINVTMQNRNILKRFQGDMFGNIALGVKSVFWPVFVIAPLLLIPAAIYYFTESRVVAFSVTGVVMFYSVLLFPAAMIHMNQNYTYPAWLLVDMSKVFVRVAAPSLFWLVIALTVMLPAIGIGIGVAALWGRIQTQYSASMNLAVQWCNVNISKFDPGGMGEFVFYEWPLFSLLMLLVFFVLSLLTAFSALFIMRANGLIGYYFQDRLALVNEQFANTPVGFGPRYLAFLVDLMLVPFAPVLIPRNRTPMMIVWFSTAVVILMVMPPTRAYVGGILVAVFHGYAVPAAICGLLLLYFVMYFGLSESGYEQCTVGKNGLGLIVTDKEGKRIAAQQGILRAFSKLLSMAIAGIGFVILLFNPQRRTLHDTMVKSLVVWRGDETS